MNANKLKYSFLLITGLLISLSSCKDYFDINVDPNQSTISRIDLQLSTAQVYIGDAIGQRIAPTCNIWSQYVTGGPGVSIGEADQHKLSSTEGNGLYRGLMRSASNLDYIINTASKQNNYVAVAKILKAYNFQVCADMFGDLPYSEALKGGEGIYSPTYESAKDVIYPDVENQLKSAIALISSADASMLVPASDDFIYQGDMEKWTKLANTLLLKLFLRQGESAKTKAAALYTAAGADHFITINDDMAFIPYAGGPAGSNPAWTAAKSTALGNYYVATTVALDYLSSTLDPRIDYFYDKSKNNLHEGMKPGDVQNAPAGADFSRQDGALVAGGGIIFSPTAPIILVSAWEGNLLLAEAAARGWFNTLAEAEANYIAAVEANFEYLGVEAADATADSLYLTGPAAFNAVDAVKSIAKQKWVCMNGLQPVEAWIETRRLDTGSNALFSSPGGLFLSPTLNALGGNLFPSILPYPESEESLNANFPGQHPITSKVFWDN